MEKAQGTKKTKREYYLKNKNNWKKGGKYYNYKPRCDTDNDIKLEVKHGKFIISFD